MPLWQEAPRGIGTATGLAGAGNGCCAVAEDKNASDAARVAIATRGLDQGIDVTGTRTEEDQARRGSFLQATGRIDHRPGYPLSYRVALPPIGRRQRWTPGFAAPQGAPVTPCGCRLAQNLHVFGGRVLTAWSIVEPIKV
jgi:hypothetical protein